MLIFVNHSFLGEVNSFPQSSYKKEEEKKLSQLRLSFSLPAQQTALKGV